MKSVLRISAIRAALIVVVSSLAMSACHYHYRGHNFGDGPGVGNGHHGGHGSHQRGSGRHRY